MLSPSFLSQLSLSVNYSHYKYQLFLPSTQWSCSPSWPWRDRGTYTKVNDCIFIFCLDFIKGCYEEFKTVAASSTVRAQYPQLWPSKQQGLRWGPPCTRPCVWQLCGLPYALRNNELSFFRMATPNKARSHAWSFINLSKPAEWLSLIASVLWHDLTFFLFCLEGGNSFHYHQLTLIWGLSRLSLYHFSVQRSFSFSERYLS